ncbi:hypothetical protein ACFL2C_04210, partial [Patescibacteria group bacterium]
MKSRINIKSTKHSKIIILTSVFVCVFILLFVSSNKFLDPDFGWHLKMGEYILGHGGVPETDPFSYTMASFPFIDHEWLTNVYFYKLYNSIGKFGLASLFSCYLLFALFISVRNTMSRRINQKIYKYSVLLLIPLVYPVFTAYFGVRPQVQSWFLFSVLFHFLFRKQIWDKYKFLLVPFMIFWTNLHGSFSAGVITILAYIVLRTLRKRKLQLSDLLLGVLVILATFANAYGVRIWHEVW